MVNSRKTVVMILTREFPAYHCRKGEPTGFAASTKTGRKLHSIRGNYAQWEHNISKVREKDFILSLREWSGKPKVSRQTEICRVDGASGIGVQKIEMTYDPLRGGVRATIDGRPYDDISRLASNDGLSEKDFIEMMFGEGRGRRSVMRQTFEGAIIQFTGFRY